MISIIVFYVLVVLAVGLVSWSFLSPGAFPLRPGWALSLTGAVILLASMLFLPWLTADPQDVRAENLAWLKTKPNPWWPARAIIAVREKEIPNPLETFDLKGYLCDTPKRQRWCALLENHTSLSAWQLLVKAPAFSILFNVTLWGRLVLGVHYVILTARQLPPHVVGWKGEDLGSIHMWRETRWEMQQLSPWKSSDKRAYEPKRGDSFTKASTIG